MFIRIGYDLSYQFPAATDLVLMLHLRPEVATQLVTPERLTISPNLPTSEYLDAFGNRCTRLSAPAGVLELKCDAIVEDPGQPAPVVPDAIVHPIADLPPDVLQYLLPSRYCDLELLHPLAWSLAQATPANWSRVQFLCDWVHGHLQFDYQRARPTRTALEAYNERTGVCRDFTHLTIALCRCLNIPARYATGYLGDIGVPADPAPMDFSAWMEVYLGGRWHTFDIRHNRRPAGQLVMAVGRDAADVAFTTSFGPHLLQRFIVVTKEISPEAAAVAA